MKLAVISFTRSGSLLNLKIKELLEGIHTCTCYYKGRGKEDASLIEVTQSLSTWCETVFAKVEGIIFIGATGIAVRTIAPFIKDKTKDPLVLVIDEKASFVISLLSGHVGGGNELTTKLSELLNAVPVITTATDINNKFAVDVFAKKENLFLTDLKLAKEISAIILEDKKIGLTSCLSIEGKIPDELILIQEDEQVSLPDTGICISLDETKKPFEKTLNLIANRVVIGIGCKKNIPPKKMEEFILSTLKEQHISIHAIKSLASIDLKAKESCILEFASKYKIPFVTYTTKELEEVVGDFEESDFVKNITGVGNVCERAAMRSCNNPALIMRKKAHEGMTLAFAIEKEMRGIRFE